MGTNLPSCFSIEFLEQLLKFLVNFVEICLVSEKLWLFNHKRADFWFPNFEFKTSFLSLLELQLHDAIYLPRFYSSSLTHILSLSNSQNNVASIQKNRGDKSHPVIVA